MTIYQKIIFTGPVGAGKTTAIASLSDEPPVSTDIRPTDEVLERKSATTVAMDYGAIHLEDGEIIHLYGTPGQERFDFMWDILTIGGIGLVLLVDNSRPRPIQDMHYFLDAFGDFIQQTHVAIGVTQRDVCATPTLAEYQSELSRRGLNPPLFSVDARIKRDVALLVQALLYSLDPRLNQ